MKTTLALTPAALVKVALLAASALFAASPINVRATNFTAGDLAFVVAAASASNTGCSVVEINAVTAGQSGTGVQTISVPSTGSGGIRVSGSAGSTLYVADSNDGTLLAFTGVNTTDTTDNVNGLNPRAVVSVNNAGSVSIAATYTGATSGGLQTRGATTVNNSTWFIGDQNGFYTGGATAPSPSGNIRSVKSFGSIVYALTASASLPPVGIISAATGGTYTALTGLGNGTTSIQDFYLISSGNNASTYDVLYVLSATSATAGTIAKYSLVSGAWTANGSYATTFGGFGLCAAKSGSGAVLYITTGTGATTANSVIKLTDTAGYNAAITTTAGNNVTLYTTATGTIIKGIAFAPVSYTVTYNANSPGGTQSGSVPTDSTAYASGATVTVLSNPNNLAFPGYTFAGWSMSVNGSTVSSFTISSNTTFYAQWIANVSYTVTYNGNGNTGGNAPTDANSPYTSGASVTVLGNTGSLAKTGYAFAGWNTAADGSGTSYTAGNIFNILQNTTLYAVWTQSPSIAISMGSLSFLPVVVNGTSANQTYTVSGANLTANILISAPAGFQVSQSSGSGFGSSLTLTPASGTVNNTTIYVQFNPTAQQSYSGNVANTSSGATEQDVAVSGTGAFAPAVSTQGASSITASGAILNGTVTASNGAAITDRGFFFQTTAGVTTSGTQADEGGATVAAYSKAMTGLNPNQIYYFRAYAVNVIGTTLDSSDNSFYTLASTPTAPTVGSPTPTSLQVTIGSGDGNPSATTYAIQEASSGKYIQVDGTLGASAVYQSVSTWGTITVSGLTHGANYTFQVKAHNGAGLDTAFGLATTASTTALPFTPGDLVIYRIGDGVASEVSSGNPVFLDEYTMTGSLVQSVAMPITKTGLQYPLIASGVATSEGYLARSLDGRYLLVPGYGTNLGGGTLSGTTAATVPRVMGRVDGLGNIDTSTALSDWGTGSNPRDIASTDGTVFWGASGAGVNYTTLGSTTSTLLTNKNARGIAIYNNQLYLSSQSGGTLVATVGTGVPTTGPNQTIANLAGISGSFTPNGFVFLTLNGGAAPDTLYVTDDSATGNAIDKWCLNSGTGDWVLQGSIAATAVRGLTATVSGTNVTLYATTGGSAAAGGGSIYTVTDTAGYNAAPSSPTVSTIATAAANTAFRGVAFAPKGSQTITAIGTTVTKTYGDNAYSVAATASSGLTVSYSSDNTSVAMVNAGGTVVITGAGTAHITASQAGNDFYKAATSVQQTLIVNPALVTITANADSKDYGQTKTYGSGSSAFTITSGSLQNSDVISTVTLTDTAGGGVATAAVGGIYPLAPSTAVFTTGSAANYTITYAPGLLTVNKGTPTFSGVTSPSISYGTASVSLSGTVSAGAGYPADGGTVSVTINGVTLNTTIAGGAGGYTASSFPTAPLPPAYNAYPITYAYTGDSNLSGVTNNSTALTVTGIKVPNLVYTNAPGITRIITVAEMQTYGLASSQQIPSYTITSVDATSAAGGTVTRNGGNTAIQYNYPTSGTPASDSFHYTVSDGAASASGTVTITFTTQAGPLLSPGMDDFGHAVISFHGIPGYSYHVQRATTLANGGDWTNAAAVTVPSNGDGSYSWTNTVSSLDGYYRLSYP